MNKLQTTVSIVLEQQRLQLSPSTYIARENYLKRLLSHAEDIGISVPCQELYDSYVAGAVTHDLRFQLFHAARLVDKEAGTKAFTPEGKLYNEPELPSPGESEVLFQTVTFPIADNSIDIGHLIRRAAQEMEYLQLSSSTNGQYMKAWRELYIFLYLRGDTTFNRTGCNAFIDDVSQKHQEGILHTWKQKIQRRAAYILLEVAETGCFKWKLFLSRKVCCTEDTLEELRLQYIAYLRVQNLENSTIALQDYAFRSMIEGVGVGTALDLYALEPNQIQSMLIFLSEKLSLNSRGTIFPVIRQILSYLHASGFTAVDLSGMIMTPFCQRMHLRPYITPEDETKLYHVMKEAPLRTKAMMRLALRLGLRDTDICGLRFSQIDWRNDQIFLEQQKTGAALCLPLLEDVGNAIMEYILNERPKAAGNCPFVFVRKQAPFQKIESMYNDCAKLFEQAGVKTVNRESHGVHACRHTLTHKLLLNKVPHQVITDTLGHVSKESDKPYISMEEQMLRECPLDFSLVGQKYWEEGDGHA